MLSPCRRPGFPPTSRSYQRLSPLRCDSSHTSSDTSSTSSPISTDGDAILPRALPWGLKQESEKVSRSIICIDILPDDGHYASSSQRSPAISHIQAGDDDSGIVRVVDHPRPLRCIDPTITFLSRSPISATSKFLVYHMGRVVHSEATSMELCDPPASSSSDAYDRLLYSTTLAPNYWKRILQSDGKLAIDIMTSTTITTISS